MMRFWQQAWVFRTCDFISEILFIVLPGWFGNKIYILWLTKRMTCLYDLQKLVSECIQETVRFSLDDARQYGFDSEMDKRIWITCLKLTNPHEFSDKYPNLVSSRNEEVQEIWNLRRKDYAADTSNIDQIQSDVESIDQVKRLQSYYWMVGAMISRDSSSAEDSKYALNYQAFANSLHQDAYELDINGISKFRIEVTKLLKEVDNALKDREAFKANINLTSALISVQILAFATILTSFLYVDYFYGYFGFNVSLYFTVSDYLAVSVEQIYKIGLMSLLAMVMVLWGYNSNSRESLYTLRTEKRQKPWVLICIILALIMLTLNNISLSYEIYKKVFFADLVPIFMMVLFFLPYPIAKRFFHAPIKIAFVLYACGTILIYTYSSASNQIKKIEDKILNGDCVKVEFLKAVPISLRDCNFTILGQNSSYLFLVTHEERQPLAVRADQVVVHQPPRPEVSDSWLDLVGGKIYALLSNHSS